MYKKQTKIIAGMLAFMLTIANFSVIGQAYATSLESQSKQTNHANVEFDSYFVENEQKVHTATKTIGEENYLYAMVKVKEAGYLKNATIAAEGANFTIPEDMQAEAVSKVQANKLYMNQIKNGNTVEIAIPIQMTQNNSIKQTQLNQQNKIKITGTYVDGKGNEKKIEKEITVSLAWTAAKEAELTMQIAKFVPYNVNEQKGVLLQTNVQSYLKGNTLPVKQNKIEISVPNINGIKPQQIKVVANTTEATNGNKEGETFTTENYTYNEETNILTIQVNNEANSQGTISWVKEAKDDFTIIAAEEGVKVSIQANSEITTYTEIENKVEKSYTGEVTLKDAISNLVDFTIQTQTENISKGQMYANYNINKQTETEYKQTITANISLAEVTEKITLEQKADNFTTKQGSKIASATNTYYKTLSIEKQTFNKILGEEGKINIYVGTTLVATINQETEANAEGKLEINLAELNTNNLTIETSKPQTEGKLAIEIVKAIKGNVSLSQAQAKELNAIEINLVGSAMSQEETFANQTLTKEISFVEPTMQAELAINNNNLSTVVTNNNVKLTAILKTDTPYSSLYKDPTIQITLPREIESINVKDVEVLFDTEGAKLNLKSQQIIENSNGTKTILVTLEGAQTEYTLGAVSKGVNVVIAADITVNKLTANKQEQITMVCTNHQNAEETVQATTALNFVAPTGVVTTSEISNYAEGAQTLTSISGEEKTATIETMSKARNATFNMNVINNYNNTIDDISILGRTAFENNKDITTGEDLSSTMDMPLVSNIQVNGINENNVTIYYSENGEATKDLTNKANGWTTSPADLSKVKSYLITLNNYTMNTAEAISFAYQAQIPEGLQHNEEAYETYVAYFNNNLATGKVQDKAVATRLGVSTGTGPVLETNITSNVAQETAVKTGKFIKYTVTVKNIGEQVAEDVVATVNIPNGTNYIEFYNGETGIYTRDYSKEQMEYQIGSIQPNETIVKDLWVIVDTLQLNDICKDESHYETYETEEGETKKYHKEDITHEDSDYKTTTSATVTVTAKDLAKPIQSNTVTNTVENAYFNISTGTTTNGLEDLHEGDSFNFNISVNPYNSNRTFQNTQVKVVLPETLIYEKAEIEQYNLEKQELETLTEGITYDEATRTLTVQLGELSSQTQNKTIRITSIVNKLPEGTYEKTITSIATVSADGGIQEESNPMIDKITKEAVQVSQTCTIPNGATITTGENFSYKISIQNIGATLAGNIKVQDKLPENVQYVSTEYTVDGESKTITNINGENTTTVNVNVPKGETLEVIINVVAKAIEEDTKITNQATISSDTIGSKTTNSITHTIQKVNYDFQDTEEVTRKVMGTVWKDANNNGTKEENEEKVSNVEVMLFNNATGQLVRDAQGNVLTVFTEEDGTYLFNNISQGLYTVIFLYDTANYSATTYQKEGVDEINNNDAIDTRITIDGETKAAAITEQIAITNANIYNIDLGLVENPKFDLRLEKTVSKITVQDSTETKVYDVSGTKIAKRDLVGNKINDTTILVEYKIAVTNEGAISGYVKKIADYMPSEMKFSSELNKDWYVAENGTLYNSSLANVLINPGETKEVTLLLTKKMTEENLGLYHNTAEIYEAYNDLGIEDIDSIEGNKASNEDDSSTADVLISVKTGETILFVGLSITIVATIGIGAYFIKKKVLR